MQSVASITISFNSGRVISRHLESLLNQTRPLREIIVVDNASTDGTSEMVAKHFPQVKVIRLPQNVGASGAWAAGLEYAALQQNHEWVWSFDDDSVPPPNALESLLNGIAGMREGLKPGIISPLPVDPSGAPYPPYLWDEGFVKAPRELIQQPIWFADLVIASGSLVKREVVEHIGLPRADFFMDVFDFEYCLRAKQHGYKIAVVNNARMVHEVGNARPVKLLGYHRRWTDQSPWREYYISRNLAYLAWTLHPSPRTKRYMLRYLAIHSVQVLLFSSQKLSAVKKIAQGFMDGVRGRLGIRFVPKPGPLAVRTMPANERVPMN